MVKHVYILGAGFSRPLGGPLFDNLLTMEYWRSHSSITSKIPSEIKECLSSLHDPYPQRSIDESLGLAKRMNAEDLIALLDWCAVNHETHQARLVGDAFSQLPANLKYSVKKDLLAEINKHLKRLIACQCNSFTENLIAKVDTISPYVSWLKGLTPDDTIITFNYDIAIETIAASCGIEFPREPTRYRRDQPSIIHVHGCVEWVNDRNTIRFISRAYEEDVELFIGLPGLEKAKIRENAFMDSIWLSMKIAIQEADVVSIIGYSMPASDNMARQEILGALKTGQRVNLVVGNDSFTSGRMQSLMQPIVGTNGLGVSRVVDLKMYAQDYLPNVKHYLTYDYSVKTPR